MALQIENNNLVLLIDIGSGITTVSCDKTVTDDKWYKATVERYFNSNYRVLKLCKLIP